MLKDRGVYFLWLRDVMYVLMAAFAAFLCILPAPLLEAAQPAVSEPSKAADAPKSPDVPATSKAAAAPSPPAAIPLPDVATRAMDVSNLLRAYTAKFSVSTEIDKIREELTGVSQQVDAQTETTRNITEDGASLETLQMKQQHWQGLQRQMSAWLKTLTERATRLQDALNQIPELQATWTLTRNAAQAAQVPGPILEQIDATIAAIEANQSMLQAKAAGVLELQSRVASETTRCEAALAQIAAAQYATVGGIFERGRSWIWNRDMWDRARGVVPSLAAGVAASYRADIVAYLHKPSLGLPLHVGIFAGIALMLAAVRKKMDRWVTAGLAPASSALVFDRPYAAALTGAMFVASGPYSTAPAELKQLLEIMSLVPMIRLIRPVVYPLLIPAFYALLGLFVADNVRQAFTSAPLMGQLILVLESIAGIAVMGWLHHAGHLRCLLTRDLGLVRCRIIMALIVFLMTVFAAGFIAAALGYMRLARLLSPGVLVFSTLALTLYALVKILQGVAAFFLRVWPLIGLRMVLNFRGLLEMRLYRLLRWGAVITCLIRYLDYVGLLEPTLKLGNQISAVKLGGATFSTTIGGIFAFFLTVWGAYLFSRMIRFVLQEDVYPRTGLSIGLSYAMSSLLNYIILALGFVIASGILGVSLTQVTVLIGAFGVGIGFGLQSVVNNFVSGLILLFEQPIHVNDTIEVGDLLGKVRHIGMRASIVRTRQGSDIIVPNAQLVSENVTNWTLSDQLQRISLPVGVNYGAAPRQVIHILETTAISHPKVLPSPAPKGLMMGYGDSSINFELRAWTDAVDNSREVHSDLAVALYDALQAAGIVFPFPQLDVHLLQEPGLAAGPEKPLPIEKTGPDDQTAEQNAMGR